jgi:methyl-accepting chemotaxis protein
LSVEAALKLSQIVTEIEATASRFDQAFFEAGEGLGQGLELFDSLNRGLKAMGEELLDGSVGRANVTISALCDDLGCFSEGLPRDTAALSDLGSKNKPIGPVLTDIERRMQSAAILTRSARIEAGGLGSDGDFVSFTDEILKLLGSGRSFLKRFMQDHDALARTLFAGSAGQAAFASRHLDAIAAAKQRLNAALGEIGARRDQASDTLGKLDALAGTLLRGAEDSLVALQVGDSVRQRYEHILAALRLALDVLAEDAKQADPIGAGPILVRLAAALLAEADDSLATETRTALDALSTLSVGSQELLRFIESSYAVGESGTTFVGELRQELSRAAHLLKECANAGQEIDDINRELPATLSLFDQNVPALESTINDVTLIGWNAGLRAGRLGSEGRGLVVIANEIRTVCGKVSQEAKQLGPLILALQRASRTLLDTERPDVARLSHSDETVQAIMSDLDDLDQFFARRLPELNQTSTRLSALLSQAYQSLERVVRHTGDEFQELALLIEAQDWGDVDVTDDICNFVDSSMRAKYTMASERRVQDAVLGVTTPQTSDEDLDLLWAV